MYDLDALWMNLYELDALTYATIFVYKVSWRKGRNVSSQLQQMFKSLIALCVIFFVFVCDAATDKCGKTIVTGQMNAVIKGFGNGASHATGGDACLKNLQSSCSVSTQVTQGGRCACGYVMGTQVSREVANFASTSMQTFFNTIVQQGFTQNSITLEANIGGQKGLGIALSCSDNGQDKNWVQQQINGWINGKVLTGQTKAVSKSYNEWYIK